MTMKEFQHLNTPGVFDPSAIYSHVVIPPAGRTVFLAGQWGAVPDGAMVDGGFGEQVTQAFSNVQIHLAALGIGPGHVLKLTHYVVDLNQEKRAVLHAAASKIWPVDKPGSTLLGVACLARDEMMYEVDVQAVIPD
jgi:2-iminobutanoate/2-iminopropanoate deaminase